MEDIPVTVEGIPVTVEGIPVTVEDIPVTVEAAVTSSLPVEVILGTDASRMMELLGRRVGSVFFTQEDVMVVTRAKR